MDCTRRRFLGGLVAGLIVAPAIVRASSLMSVKNRLITPLDAGFFYCPYIPLIRDDCIFEERPKVLSSRYSIKNREGTLIEI